jgi:hypothetical protein
MNGETPYLCTPHGLIPLAPGLLYQPRASDGRYGLYLLDGIAEYSLRYKSVQENGKITRAEGLRDISEWVRLPFEVPSTAPAHPLLESIACLDGRSLHGHLSGEELVASVTCGPVVGSIRDFEQRLNGLGLGAVYRDVLYCLEGHGAHAELSGGGVRVLTTSKPARVLTTVELAQVSILVITIFAGAFASGGSEQVESHEFRPGDTADHIVGRIEELFEITLTACPDSSSGGLIK